MADASLINIGLSGVRAHQAALATTGQNITNASTPGYTRQRVNLEAQVSNGIGVGAQGVTIQGVERIYDGAIVNQVRLDTSSKARYDEFLSQISQVDSLLADEASNLNRGFERFFDALHSAANAPSSLPARQLVISEADGLVARFQSLDGRMRDQLAGVDGQAESELRTINELAASIADFNARLGPLDGDDPNSNALLDQRDEVLRQLAEYADITTVAEGELGVNVFIGKGQALVVGATATPLQMSAEGQVQIRPPGSGPALPVNIRGGSLGGLLAFRDETLEPVLNELGRLALSFSATVNDIHAEGLSLRGEYGGNLFADANSAQLQSRRVQAANDGANRSSLDLTLRVDDPSAVAASDYRVVFDGDVGAFSVQRQSDGAVVAGGTLGAARPLEVSFDGLTLAVGEGSVQAGAEYRLSTAGTAVADLAVALRDPRDLALASPVSVSTGDANQGTGKVALDGVTDVTGPLFGGDGQLVPPLLVRFTSETSYEVLDNSDPSAPKPMEPPIWGLPFVPGGSQPLLPEDGQRLLVADGLDAGALAGSAATSSDLSAVANGFGAESVRFARPDGSGGSATFDQVDITPGMSARAIAAAMQQVDGVSAAARTELSITGLEDNGIGEPLTVAVNGEALVLAPGSGLGDLADAINTSTALGSAGIRALSDGETLTLSSARGDDLALHVAGDVSDAITVTDASGTDVELRGSGVGGDYATVTVGGSVRLLLDGDVTVQSTSSLPGGGLFSSQPVALAGGLGFQATVTGRPQAGDAFAIDFNEAGNLDNHNALALAKLQIAPSLGDPPVNFAESYSSIVERVGILTSQARSDAQAAEGLLQQSVARRESLSGVNLDEEAANLIKFEQGYNASARVISIANEIFDVLLGAVA